LVSFHDSVHAEIYKDVFLDSCGTQGQNVNVYMLGKGYLLSGKSGNQELSENLSGKREKSGKCQGNLWYLENCTS